MNALKKGRLITFEGGDGTGKTTQIQHLSSFLDSFQIPHVITREPGGTENAEFLRETLLKGSPAKWQPLTEALLMSAARVEHITHVIQPALSQGTWVICDRFADSTLAYQGWGHELGQELIQQLNTIVLKNFQPDLTCILYLPNCAQGLSRKNQTACAEDRFEKMDLSFHERVQKGYEAIAAQNPERCLLIDARESETVIAQTIQKALRHKFSFS